MTWNRWELGQKAIFYDDHATDGSSPIQYPPHVETLRKYMLDFSCAIRGSEDEPHDFQLGLMRAWQGGQAHDPASAAAHVTHSKAKSIYQGGYSEKRWENFFQSQFFEPLAHSTSVSKGDSRRVSRCNYYYDAFRAESNESWDLFRGRTDDSASLQNLGMVKCPKPDYAFYLPIYNLSGIPSIPNVGDPEARQWNQSPEHALAEPFSWSVLKELSLYDLLSSPFRIFDKFPREANLKCFPWLLVEHKKEGLQGLEEIVCCQAANGGACALKLNQSSAKYAFELPDHAHIPPIPLVTTIGSQVKVWIMYFAKDFDAPCSGRYTRDITFKRRKAGYIMKVIWKGDMTNVRDVIKFQMVLENTHTWAMRVFKPLMSSYIDQWKHVHCVSGVDAANLSFSRHQEAIERWQTITPMIRGLLNHHSNIDLQDCEQMRVTPLLLGSIVQQICSSERQTLSNEVERVVTEKLRPLILALKTSIPEGTTTETQRTSRRASAESHQSSLTTQGPKSVGEDPNDSDYEEPTRAFRTDGLLGEPQDDENEFRRSTRSNPHGSSPVHPPTASAYQKPAVEGVSEASGTHVQDFAPATPSDSKAQKSEGPGAPKADEHTNTDSVNSPRSDASIRASVEALQISDGRTSVDKTPSKQFSSHIGESNLRGRESLSRRLFSPQPPGIESRSSVGRLDVRCQPERASSTSAKPSMSHETVMSKSSSEGAGNHRKMCLVDLTKDDDETS